MDVETTLVIPIIAMGTIRDAIMDKFVAIKVRPMVLLLSVNKLTMVGSAIAKAIAVPLLLLPLGPAVAVSVVWGLLVIVILSYFLAKSQGESPLMIIGEHLGIAILVVVLSHFIGVWVSETFT